MTPPTTIDDALDGLPARDLERLRARIDQRLRACVLCGSDGALAVHARAKAIGGNDTQFALLLCRACIEKHRLPERRSEAT